jgi:hypothetical protein
VPRPCPEPASRLEEPVGRPADPDRRRDEPEWLPDRDPHPDDFDWRQAYFLGAPILFCCACGAPLGPDPDDTTDAEGPGRHFCGDCYRSREMDAELAFAHFEHDR